MTLVIPTVAVVGAAGLVGREILTVLEERRFPRRGLLLFSTSSDQGRAFRWRGRELETQPLADGWWRGIDVAFFAASSSVSRRETPRAAAEGVLVVDNSSAFRGEREVPLVVPEVNGEDLSRHGGIVANPNCCTIQLVMALAPLERRFGLKRVQVATYQSVSGAGAAALESLEKETRSAGEGRDPRRDPGSPLPRGIGYNLVFKHREKQEVIHSRRYEFYREGLDDYRYVQALLMASRQKGEAAEREAQALVREAVGHITADVRDVSRCEQWRRRIADQILKLQARR